MTWVRTRSQKLKITASISFPYTDKYLLGARDIRPDCLSEISIDTSGRLESKKGVKTCCCEDSVENVGRIAKSFEGRERQGNINCLSKNVTFLEMRNVD